jgi:hypothetical protein
VRPAAALCLLALAVGGCGASSDDSSDDFEGEERVVAVAVEDLEEAGRDNEPRRICGDLLADSLIARLRQAGTNCRTAVDEALEDADSFDLEVDDIRIERGRPVRATVRVTSGSGDDEETDTLLLEREGRTWKIASLGAAGPTDG